MQHLKEARAADATATDVAPKSAVDRKQLKLKTLHERRETMLATGHGNDLWRGLLDQVTARGYVTRKKSLHVLGCKEAPVNGVLTDVLVKDVPLRPCCTARLVEVSAELASFIETVNLLEKHRKRFNRQRQVRRARFYVTHAAEQHRRALTKIAETDLVHGFGLAPSLEKLLTEIVLWERAVENENVDLEVRVVQLARIAVGPSRDQDGYGTKMWRRMHVQLGRRLGMRFDRLTDLFYGRMADLLEDGVHRDAIPGMIFREAVLSRYMYRFGTKGYGQVGEPTAEDYENNLFIYEAAEHYLAAIVEEARHPVVFTAQKPHPVLFEGRRLLEEHPQVLSVLFPQLAADSSLTIVDVDPLTREWFFRAEVPVIDVASMRLGLRRAKTLLNNDDRSAVLLETNRQLQERGRDMVAPNGWWLPER